MGILPVKPYQEIDQLMKGFLWWIFPAFLLSYQGNINAQQSRVPLLVDFTIPDTACAGQMISIENSSPDLLTYYWSFCSGDAGKTPLGMLVNNLSLPIMQPEYISMVRSGDSIFSFIISKANGTLSRILHGTNPLTILPYPLNMGNFGVLTTDVGGIQVKNDNGTWYAFIANENTIVRLNFGNTLMNPFPVQFSFSGLIDTVNMTNTILIEKEGNNWVGFFTNFLGNNISRLSFGTSLGNIPQVKSLGTLNGLNKPYQCSLLKENGNWFMLVSNSGDNTVSRISFGNSLLNNSPVGEKLLNISGLQGNWGVTLIRDCERVHGYVLNHINGNNNLTRLNFPDGIAGPVTSDSLGNIGNLFVPGTFSEFLRIGDSLYTLVTNTGNSSITALYFPSCTNASIPSSNQKVPPPISYALPGTYNIMMVTNEGLPTQENVCKPITIIPPIEVELGNDTTVCSGKLITLATDTSFATYLWSNDSTTSTISVRTPGKYWVRVTNKWNCETSDTVEVFQLPPDSASADTSICFGDSIFIAGLWRHQAGTYSDTLKTAGDCDSISIVHLAIRPKISISLGNDTIICPGSQIQLSAFFPDATEYIWQDGTRDSAYLVVKPGEYWVHVLVDVCEGGDTVQIGDCPSQLWCPTAFTPNNDGLNDFFRPVGVSVSRFNMRIFDRWGTMIFETDNISDGWDGSTKGYVNEPGVYSYLIHYEVVEAPGEMKKVAGTFTLVR